jgi:hypothetical protein
MAAGKVSMIREVARAVESGNAVSVVRPGADLNSRAAIAI